MPAHKAEQIIVAVVAKLTGLASTGANVFRGRVYELPETSLPALRIFQGTDRAAIDGGSSSFRYLDSEISVRVEAVAKTSATQIDTLLNQIRKEVTVALQADVTQGLSFVMDTSEGMADIDLDGEGDRPTGVLKMEWSILYRRLRTDPSL